MSDSLVQELQSLQPSAIIELFELEIPNEAEVYRFHAGTNGLNRPLAFGYEEDLVTEVLYEPFPIEADGFSSTVDGQLPRPTLKISNVLGFITALSSEFNDLIGAKVRRIRTFKKFLNSSNFPGNSNPTEDPNAKFPTEYYLVERKTLETKDVVEFELAVPWDVQGIKLPKRQILSTICSFTYRGEGCNYAGPPIASDKDTFIISQADIDNNDSDSSWQTRLLPIDKCGKRLASCRLRFVALPEDADGQVRDLSTIDLRDDILNFGGFPGAGRLR